MSDDQSVVRQCILALKAARPFVLDGRSEKDAERALVLVDAALADARDYLQDEDAKADRR